MRPTAYDPTVWEAQLTEAAAVLTMRAKDTRDRHDQDKGGAQRRWLDAAQLARGSATRLFTLVFIVGTIVTAFLSNDATAVVLTPAVAAVVKAAKAQLLSLAAACLFD